MNLQGNLYRIYFPMTCSIITPGHIRCLEFLNSVGFVTVGLLTPKALEGYKKEVVPYEDRKFVLEKVLLGIQGTDVIEIIPQDSLDPTENLLRTNCNAIASGDGWEEIELAAIRDLMVDAIDVHLEGETVKKYSSTEVYNNLNTTP